MKKYLFIASAALIFAACSSSNDNVNEIEELETPIQFSEYLGKSTRAEIANEQALAKAGGFKVWGYKNKKTAETDWSGKTTVFEGTTVTGTDVADPVWSYTTTKYWDKTCNYKFYAAGPVKDMTGTLSCIDDATNMKAFKVEGAASALASASASDFVIDRVVNTKDASTVTDGYKEVFDFHHIMAKVSFKVKKAEGITETLVLKSMKMSGWNEKTGTFVQAKFDGTWNALNATEWTLAETSTAGETAELASDQTLTTTAEALTGKDYIMVPQVIAAKGLKFTLTYTLGGETFSDQDATLEAAQTWGTDSHTTYTITVGPKAIKFDVTSVCDFCAVDAAGDVEVE